MGQCTPQNVFDSVRALLNDNQLSSSGISWQNSRLQSYFAIAYRKMYDAWAGIANNRVRHTVYFQLPPYTTIWVPTANNITDMSEPEVLSERSAVTTGSITSTDTSTPIRVAAPGHGLSTNADVITDGIAGTLAPWGRFFITVIDANTFSLNGSASDGNAGTGGTWSTGTQKFVDMMPVSRITDEDPSGSLINWWWENNALNFRGATQTTQVRLIYIASGTAPTNANTTIMIDNCLNFLTMATAGYAIGSVGLYERQSQLLQMAFGPKGEADAGGGMLRDLIQTAVLELQREPRYPKNFRPSKNTLIPYTFG